MLADSAKEGLELQHPAVSPTGCSPKGIKLGQVPLAFLEPTMVLEPRPSKDLISSFPCICLQTEGRCGTLGMARKWFSAKQSCLLVAFKALLAISFSRYYTDAAYSL